jgi:hypothetical protein
MIDITKHYKTRDDREVKLLMTDGGSRYPVLGAIKDTESGHWVNYTWTSKGEHYIGESSDEDLVEEGEGL